MAIRSIVQNHIKPIYSVLLSACVSFLALVSTFLPGFRLSGRLFRSRFLSNTTKIQKRARLISPSGKYKILFQYFKRHGLSSRYACSNIPRKKKGRPLSNIGKISYTSLTVKSALPFFFSPYLLWNILLIRSFTTRSGTYTLSRSLQTQSITDFFCRLFRPVPTPPSVGRSA